MTYNEAYQQLSAMGSPFGKSFSSSERTTISFLYGNILGKTIKNLSCGDCYRDAFIELELFLREYATDETLSNYRLKDGETLHFFGEVEYYCNPISDELAERFLRRFPTLISKFEKYPEDWEQRIKKTSEDSSSTKPKRGRGRPKAK